jgi:hypothetical protein
MQGKTSAAVSKSPFRMYSQTISSLLRIPSSTPQRHSPETDFAFSNFYISRRGEQGPSKGKHCLALREEFEIFRQFSFHCLNALQKAVRRLLPLPFARFLGQEIPNQFWQQLLKVRDDAVNLLKIVQLSQFLSEELQIPQTKGSKLDTISSQDL